MKTQLDLALKENEILKNKNDCDDIVKKNKILSSKLNSILKENETLKNKIVLISKELDLVSKKNISLKMILTHMFAMLHHLAYLLHAPPLILLLKMI